MWLHQRQSLLGNLLPRKARDQIVDFHIPYYCPIPFPQSYLHLGSRFTCCELPLSPFQRDWTDLSPCLLSPTNTLCSLFLETCWARQPGNQVGNFYSLSHPSVPVPQSWGTTAFFPHPIPLTHMLALQTLFPWKPASQAGQGLRSSWQTQIFFPFWTLTVFS